MLTLMKRFGAKFLLGLVSIAVLGLPYLSPGSTASALAKAMLWGFLGTLLLLLLGGSVFFWNRLRGKKPVATKPVAGTSAPTAPAAKEPGGQVGAAFMGALISPFTWAYLGFLFWGVRLYSPKLLAAPNLVWMPLGLWAIFVLVSQARMSSKMKNGGKEKKAAPGLTTAATIFYRLAFISTLGVIAFYALLAPPGTWGKLTERPEGTRGTHSVEIPKGIPLNPQLTGTMLAHWEVFYVAANPQYSAPQTKWGGKKLVIREEPRREITKVVHLTVGLDNDSAPDIHLEGTCIVISDNKTPDISKSCAGWWEDQGGNISGQFSLKVIEAGGGRRYVDACLYPGNHLPKEALWAPRSSCNPIPAIVLQFRPKNWGDKNNM